MAASNSAFNPEAIVRSVDRYQGPGEPGYIIDFLGTKTRTSYVAGLARSSGAVEDYPIPGNFHATTLEWAGTLHAALEAKDNLVAVELGAGWAPWLVAIARIARARHLRSVQLVGVEGSAAHCEFIASHFRDNGIEPADHTILHGIIGVADGTATFPVLGDPAVDYGARAASDQPRWKRALQAVKQLRAPQWKEETVRCYSLATLIEPFPHVDLIHFDIQGDEFAVVDSAIDLLDAKVKQLVIGTHSREIEDNLRQLLQSHAWQLLAEEACVMRRSRLRRYLALDGCQIWTNPRV